MIEWTNGYVAIVISLSLFVLFAVIEVIAPRRALVLGRYARWVTHALFFISNAFVGRLLSLLVAVAGTAAWAEHNKVGLFYLTDLPWWAKTIIAFIVLDFAVWLQHIFMHRIPLFWRLHKVHHSDRDLDVTTALRFHPSELVVSTLYKSIWVLLLGVPIEIALAFELWLNGNAMFNHSNLALPGWLNRIIRLVLVTPDMHLVHHSVDIREQNHNFGFALTIWDRLAGYYMHESRFGRDGETIGLIEAQNGYPAQITWSLLLPFRG